MRPALLDIVVFGATGYTGRFVVTELVRISDQHPGLTWAVAGRSRVNLDALVEEVSINTALPLQQFKNTVKKRLIQKAYYTLEDYLEDKNVDIALFEPDSADLSSVRVITADVDDEASLRSMCVQTKVVLNCCGPFVKLGEPVVAMAVDCKAHYVDVSGEQRFFEIVERKYDELARRAGVYVITTCGLSSIPADLGVIYLEDNFKGTLKSVESYLVIHFPQQMLDGQRNGVVRYSTWESMINSFSTMPVTNLIQKLLPGKPEKGRENNKTRYFIHRHLNRWCLPFPGTDAAIVNRTQRHLAIMDKKLPVQYKSYITFPSILTTIMILFAGALIFLLSKISFTRYLLLKYPRAFSFGRVTYGHPKAGIMDDMRFQYEMFGEGCEEGVKVGETPTNRKLHGRVTAAGRDPAYVGTAVIVIHAALAILKEEDNLPGRGGVLTPGFAFRNTSIMKNLQQNNVKFEIVNQ